MNETRRINKSNVYFILVEPRTPGNIGASARALKTMGFENLILINPADHLCPEARWMAHASEDILESALIYPTLEEAVNDKHLVVGTTQRERGLHFPYFTPKELGQKSIEITENHILALVFGREKTGLTNEELTLCDAISTVPAHTGHPSLNLGQTVMVYCYELYQASYQELKKYNWNLATHEELALLYRHLHSGLDRVGFVPIDNWENFLMRFSRLMGRANAEVRDVKVWHKIIKSFEQHIDLLEDEIKQLRNTNHPE